MRDRWCECLFLLVCVAVNGAGANDFRCTVGHCKGPPDVPGDPNGNRTEEDWANFRMLVRVHEQVCLEPRAWSMIRQAAEFAGGEDDAAAAVPTLTMLDYHVRCRASHGWARDRSEVYAVLDALTRRTWDIPAGKSPAEYLRELEVRFERKRTRGAVRFREARAEYRVHADRPSTLDWTLDRARWESFFTAVVRTSEGGDPARVWRPAISGAGKAARLFRIAYIRSLVARRYEDDRPRIAIDLLEPLHADPSLPVAERLRSLCIVGSILHQESATGGEVDEAIRRARQSVDRKVEEVLSGSARLGLWTARHELAKYHDDVPASRRRRLDRLVVENMPVETAWFVLSTCFGAEEEDIRRAFLSKPTRVHVPRDDDGLTALRGLAAEVPFTLWVDTFGGATDREIRLEGTWFEVVSELSDRLSLELEVLDDEVFCVTHRGEVDRARRTWEASVTAARGRDELGDEFDGSDYADGSVSIPDLLEVANYSREILLPADRSAHREAFPPTTPVPAHLAVSVMAREWDLDWAVDERALAFGPESFVDRFREVARRHRNRKPALGTKAGRGHAVAEALLEIVSLDRPHGFAGQSAREIVPEYAEYEIDGRVTILVLDDFRLQQFPNRRQSLAWFLDMLLLESDERWSYDESVVVIGGRESVAEFEKRADNRERRRATYPKDFRGGLTSQTLEPDERCTTVREALEFVGTACDLAIRIDDAVEKSGALDQKVLLGSGTADALLDALSLQIDANWSVRADGMIRLSPAE